MGRNSQVTGRAVEAPPLRCFEATHTGANPVKAGRRLTGVLRALTLQGGAARSRLFGIVGEDFVVIDVEGFFLVTAHEVDVELGDPDRAEAL